MREDDFIRLKDLPERIFCANFAEELDLREDDFINPVWRRG